MRQPHSWRHHAPRAAASRIAASSSASGRVRATTTASPSGSGPSWRRGWAAHALSNGTPAFPSASRTDSASGASYRQTMRRRSREK